MIKINQKKKEINMENIEYSNSLYQINEILKYVTPNLKARIPKKVISYIQNNKSKDFNWKIDKALPLEKQELLPTTKELITVLYKDYMCDDIAKAKLDKVLNENQIKYENEVREKYNPDNIFKQRNKSNEKIQKSIENNQIVSYKESFLSKIINKLKSFFHK